MNQGPDVVVIGAGLGGLATAALLARAGYRVRVLERSKQAGGRAHSRVRQGYTLNIGAHALTRGGPALRTLRTLGIEVRGGRVGGGGAHVLYRDRLYPMPSTLSGIVGSELLGRSSKWALLKLMASLGERKARSVRGLTVRQWLQAELTDDAARALLEMLVRLTCYAHAPELLSAELAVLQLQRASRAGVLYVHGGWEQLVTELLLRAQAAGVDVTCASEVEQIELTHGAVSAVLTRDGQRFAAAAVVAALGPAELASLLPDDGLAQSWARTAVPLRAACLDLGVAGSMPVPLRTSVQSLDAPLYFANHSAIAQLAPPGDQVVHLIRYLGPGEDGRGCDSELEAFLERVQPGAAAQVQVRRFAPNLVVHNDLPGRERARSEHPEIAGLSLVGDSASPRSLLADAVFDSATQALTRVRAYLPLRAANIAGSVP